MGNSRVYVYLMLDVIFLKRFLTLCPDMVREKLVILYTDGEHCEQCKRDLKGVYPCRPLIREQSGSRCPLW